ncbi:hypothetical protein D3C76_1392070 [compost metagenome]
MTDGVSCKSCQRSLVKPDAAAATVRKSPSLAELRKTAKAAAAPVAVAPVAQPAAQVVSSTPALKPAAPAKASEKPARRGGFSVKSAWAARLAEQGDQCRLPRGKVKQRHV